MVVILHIIEMIVYISPYISLCIVMSWKDRFDTEFTCEGLLVSSVTLRFFLLFRRRHQFAGLIDECRELYSYLQEDELAILKYYEKIVNFFRMYWLITGYGSVFTIITGAYLIQYEDDDGNIYRKTGVKFV